MESGQGIDKKELVTQCQSFRSCNVALGTTLFSVGLPLALFTTDCQEHNSSADLADFPFLTLHEKLVGVPGRKTST